MMNKFEPFDKPFVDIPELLELLQTRGITVTNSKLATEILKNYGYYSLINGFKRGFLTPASTHDAEIFEAGTSILDITGHYLIDTQFQQLFLTAVFPIENQFRTLIGYEVAKSFGVNNFGPDDTKNPNASVKSYLDVNLYKGKSRNNVIYFIHQQVLNTANDPTAYYRNHHNHIPPWIMMTNMMLGTAIKYFRILPAPLRLEIAQVLIPSRIETNAEQLTTNMIAAMDALRQFRNAAAHSSPIYLTKAAFKRNALAMPSKKFLSQYLGTSVFKGLSGYHGIDDLFAALCYVLLLTPQSNRRLLFLNQLQGLDQQNRDPALLRNYQRYLKQAGLPLDFMKRLTQANQALDQLMTQQTQ